jgi:hypothetical protein
MNDARQRLVSARFSGDLREALAALEEIREARLYDLILDALRDERVEVRERAAAIASPLLTAQGLDLSQLPTEVEFSAYFGAAELQAIRDAAKPRRENVAGMLGILLPEVEAELRALSEDEFEDARQQSQPLAKVRLGLSGAFLFKVRLLAWRFDQSPSAVLHVIWALGKQSAATAAAPP